MTDLFDLVDGLKREVNSIGADSFPDATDDEWLGNLQDGFWEQPCDGALILGTHPHVLHFPGDRPI